MTVTPKKKKSKVPPQTSKPLQQLPLKGVLDKQDQEYGKVNDLH